MKMPEHTKENNSNIENESSQRKYQDITNEMAIDIEKLPQNIEMELTMDKTDVEIFEMIMRERNKKDETEKENPIIEEVIESALDSKVHGISNMVRIENPLLKLIWIVLWLASCGYCLYLIIAAIVAFTEYKVVPKISLKYEMPTEFPAVGFCNLDPYDGNTALKDLNDILDKDRLTEDRFPNAIDYVRNANRLFKANFERRDRNASDPFSLFVNGFYLNQTLISCRFKGKKCDIDDFYYFHDFDYGSCYRFNGGKVNGAREQGSVKRDIEKITLSGWENGLQLELFTGNPFKQQQYNFKGGVRVFVHNQTIKPFPNDDGLDAGAGQQTNIAIIRQFVKRLGKPYSSCLETAEVDWNANEVLRFMKRSFEFEEYDQTLCFKVCQNLYFLENCKCYDVSFSPKKNSSSYSNLCYNQTQLDCLTSYTNQFYEKKAVDCYSKCHVQCENFIYNLVTSFSTYPSEWYSSLLLNNSYFVNFVINNTENFTMPAPTSESLQETILMVNVYYDDLFYTEIEDEPKVPFEALFAQIGSYLALFLGVSFLSVVEVLEIVFLVIYHSVIRYFKKRN